MTSHEDRRKPEPIWKPVTYWLCLALFAVGGIAVGWLNAPSYADLKAAEATQDSLRGVIADGEPWDYLRNCDPDPVAHLQSWDTVRDLVTVACVPGILIPEGES